MIFIIDDDEIMAECVARGCIAARGAEKSGEAWTGDARIFANALEAIDAISEGEVPDLIFLDVLLDGPDGFTLLNELQSYEDTAKIPIVIVSSLDFRGRDLSAYGVVKILDKSTMRPRDIRELAEKYGRS